MGAVALALCVGVLPRDAGAPAAQPCPARTELRLDHVPIAVRDLAAAGELFGRLGFTLKPGRLHDNGIANLHAKFRDGTELELITAAKAVDAVTRDYVEFLGSGDGAAFLALYAGEHDAVERRLRPLAPDLWRLSGVLGFPPDHAWGRVFFGLLNRSPTDRPEHFDHANGAVALRSVWIADGSVRDLAREFGAAPCGERSLPGSDTPGERIPLGAGSELLLLPPAGRLHAERAIVAVTVAVEDAEAAGALLRAAGIGLVESRRDGSRSVWIAPTIAPGVWLELREGS